MPKIRVLLFDDHSILRIGMCNLLEQASDIEVVGEATNGIEALEMVQVLTPDVLLLVLELPGISGIEVAQKIHRQGSIVHILALSAHNNRQYIESVLKSGASGYLVKDEAPDAIVEAVRGVALGEQGWISRQITTKLLAWFTDGLTSRPLLTDCDSQVLMELLTGKTNQEIGFALDSPCRLRKDTPASGVNLRHGLGVLE
jgi:DNA-binding NarL/FixJ family response regulator